VSAANADKQAIVTLPQTQDMAAQFQAVGAAAALSKAAAWLGTLGKTPGASLGQRYVSVDLIDTSTRHHQKQILDDYLALPRTRRAQERMLWVSAHDFWVALSAAYLECMAAVPREPKSAAEMTAKLPVLAARGVRAAAMQIKWISFRFGLVEPWVWSNLARCLRFAELHDIADTEVILYLSNPTSTSANKAFLRAVMLSASCTESLSVMEQEMADRWIEYFADRFLLDRRAGPAVNLYFDLDHALPPRRIMGTPAKAAHRRFIGGLEVLPHIQKHIESVREAGAAAVPFALPRDSEIKSVIKVLEHLALHWSTQQPARVWERRPTTTCLEIKHDYRSLREILENTAQGVRAADDKARPEYWIVDNAGRGGYSAIVPKGLRAWLHLGVLIAIRLEYQNFWSAAVIRRVETDEHHQHKVGIRVVARRPVAALLRSTQRSGKQARTEPGILLNTKPSGNGGVHVLMRPSTFTLDEDIDASFGADNAQSLALTPSRVVESTLDYEWVRYEVKR